MNITPVNSNDNISMHGKNRFPAWQRFKKRVYQKILDTLPEATYNDTPKTLKNFKWIDDKISRPAENRAIMGITAILTQPAIDAYNPRADEETRRMSMIKDISKITVGTCVGILVRGSAYRLVESMTNINGKTKNSKYLLPKTERHLESFIKDERYLKNYRSALSTGIAILAMCITNFAIDMPLTLILTNFLNEKTKKYTQKPAKQSEEVGYEQIA